MSLFPPATPLETAHLMMLGRLRRLCSRFGTANATNQDRHIQETVLEIELRHAEDTLLLGCRIAPQGWRCTRGHGHDGPCAAVAYPACNPPDGCLQHGHCRMHWGHDG